MTWHARIDCCTNNAKEKEKKSTNNAPHSSSYYKDPSGKKVEDSYIDKYQGFNI